MAREILGVNPDNLTGNDCSELSKNSQLRKKYEDRWGEGITEVCDIGK
jgi:hypothetical protein